jgi:hypothetical protein
MAKPPTCSRTTARNKPCGNPASEGRDHCAIHAGAPRKAAGARQPDAGFAATTSLHADADPMGGHTRDSAGAKFGPDGYGINGFDRDGIHRDTGTGFGPDGYGINGFDQDGIHQETGTDRDPAGWDANGRRPGPSRADRAWGAVRRLLHDFFGRPESLGPRPPRRW